MGDYQLEMPQLGSSLGARPQLSLGDFQLKLSPETEAILADINQRETTERLRRAWLTPDWFSYDRSADLGHILRQPLPPAFATCSWSAPAAGPDPARPGTVGDVLNAVYKIPCVRNFADGHLNTVKRYAMGVWDKSNPAQKGGIVAGAVTAVGVGIWLGPLSGRELPVPGVPGLSATVSLGKDALPPGASPSAAEGAFSFGLKMDLSKVIPALR